MSGLFMCKTDFDDELGCAAGGNKVFLSLEDLKRNLSCWDTCGVVEVSVSLVRQVVKTDFSECMRSDHDFVPPFVKDQSHD